MKPNRLISTILAMMLWLSGINQQATAQQRVSGSTKTDSSADAVTRIDSSTLLARLCRGRRSGFSLMPTTRVENVATVMPSSSNSAVHGSGTVGKISMWVDVRPNGDSTLGDSIITQSNGNIGIGLDTPTSKLSVQGMIETMLGGYKFPDGTVQTTAAVSGLQSVAHDTTLTGNGTSASPLGVAVPLTLNGSAQSNPILAVSNDFAGFGIAVQGATTDGYGVRGISNNLSGVVGISISDDGVLGQSSSMFKSHAGVRGFCNACSGVFGDSLSGLGVFGRGPVGVEGQGKEGIGGSAGTGLKGFGGFSENGSGGIGADIMGGPSKVKGGKALVASGGDSQRPFGGDNRGGEGIVVRGGDATSTNLSGNTFGGDGIVATGGNSGGTLFGESVAGSGVNATGGSNALDVGGVGVFATGGVSRDSAGNVGKGGVGLVATGGSGNPSGRAALFRGDVDINGSLDISGPAGGGNLTVSGSKNFKIDHPLDPENKYLLHAAIESSEVLNVYSGNIITDAKGEATVILPDWFEALNRDLRYQLTVVGHFAQAIVASEVRNNRFTIKTSAPNVKVSWQVTGVRSDRVMLKQPFKAEEDKPARERGSHLSPEAFGQPEEKGLMWARHPDLMRELKERRKTTLSTAPAPASVAPVVH